MSLALWPMAGSPLVLDQQICLESLSVSDLVLHGLLTQENNLLIFGSSFTCDFIPIGLLPISLSVPRGSGDFVQELSGNGGSRGSVLREASALDFVGAQTIAPSCWAETS